MFDNWNPYVYWFHILEMMFCWILPSLGISASGHHWDGLEKIPLIRNCLPKENHGMFRVYHMFSMFTPKGINPKPSEPGFCQVAEHRQRFRRFRAPPPAWWDSWVERWPATLNVLVHQPLIQPGSLGLWVTTCNHGHFPQVSKLMSDYMSDGMWTCQLNFQIGFPTIYMSHRVPRKLIKGPNTGAAKRFTMEQNLLVQQKCHAAQTFHTEYRHSEQTFYT